MARGAKPGERRGGRQKGTPNKRTQAVAETLEALSCDPIKGMATIAMDETAEPSSRAQIYKELAQYVAPKRRAMEMSGHLNMSFIDAIRESYKYDPRSEGRLTRSAAGAFRYREIAQQGLLQTESVLHFWANLVQRRIESHATEAFLKNLLGIVLLHPVGKLLPTPIRSVYF